MGKNMLNNKENYSQMCIMITTLQLCSSLKHEIFFRHLYAEFED